jgi:hypothetical protein
MFWYGFLLGSSCGLILGMILIGILSTGNHADILIEQSAHQWGSQHKTGHGCEVNQEALSTTIRTATRKPEAREYLTIYLELLHLISDLTQVERTQEALKAHQDLLAQQADIEELIDSAQDLIDLTGKKEFTETISRLKRAAQKLIDSQVA